MHSWSTNIVWFGWTYNVSNFREKSRLWDFGFQSAKWLQTQSRWLSVSTASSIGYCNQPRARTLAVLEPSNLYFGATSVSPCGGACGRNGKGWGQRTVSFSVRGEIFVGFSLSLFVATSCKIEALGSTDATLGNRENGDVFWAPRSLQSNWYKEFQRLCCCCVAVLCCDVTTIRVSTVPYVMCRTTFRHLAPFFQHRFANMRNNQNQNTHTHKYTHITL